MLYVIKYKFLLAILLPIFIITTYCINSIGLINFLIQLSVSTICGIIGSLILVGAVIIVLFIIFLIVHFIANLWE